VTFKRFFDAVIKFQNNFPYENRAGPAALTMHRSPQAYERNFYYRSELPTKALYVLTRVLATKKFAGDVA